MHDIFTLEEEELALIAEKNTNKNKLGFAVLLKHFQLEGRYPKGIQIIDPFLINDLANQLDINESVIKDFDWEGRSIERFKREIRVLTGFREATTENIKDLVSWLIAEILPKTPKGSECIEYAYEYFRSQKIEPFVSDKMERSIILNVVLFIIMYSLLIVYLKKAHLLKFIIIYLKIPLIL